MIASYFFSRSENTIRVAQTLFFADEALQTALAIETLAIAALEDDAQIDRNESRQTDFLEELWAQEVPRVPAGNGFVAGRMIDAHSFINLNNLVLRKANVEEDEPEPTVDPYTKLIATQLSENLKIENTWIDAVVDWLDEDNIREGNNGAEDATYTSKANPYRAANRAIADVHELLLVQGMDAERFARLEPHIVTINAPTKINVNTASAEVLASLSPEFSQKVVQSIIGKRNNGHFKSVKDFLNTASAATKKSESKLFIEQDLLDVRSYYFQVSGTVWLESRTLSITSYLYRNNKGKVTVLWRKFSA